MTKGHKMQVSRALAEQITDELEKAAMAIFAKHGLERGKVSTKYGELYSLKIEAQAVEVGPNGINLASVEARDYTRFGKMYDLPEGLLGKTFSFNGTEYAFAGIATSRSKYPIYVRNMSTGKYSFFQESIKRHFALTGAK